MRNPTNTVDKQNRTLTITMFDMTFVAARSMPTGGGGILVAVMMRVVGTKQAGPLRVSNQCL